MADESGVRCVGGAGVEEGFETARGPAEIVDGAEDRGTDVRVRHAISFYEEVVRYSGASL
jgi:hypothetical protein